MTPVDLVDVYAAAHRLNVDPALLRQWAVRDGWTRYGYDRRRRSLYSWRVIRASAENRAYAVA
jgi:hypothetical protein